MLAQFMDEFVSEKGAVIGARSSVFSDMPAEMICVGSPAKPIKPRMEK
jgi:putative colanic acid biosynthesis acetyltransferase WcaF